MAEEPPASPKSAKFFIPEGVYFIEGYGYGYYDLNNQWVYWYPSDSDYYERDTVESKDKDNGRDFFDALYSNSLDSPAAPPQHQQQQLQEQQGQQQGITPVPHPQHTSQEHDLFASTTPHDSFQLATHHHSPQPEQPSEHETPPFLQPPTDSVEHQNLPFDAPSADVYPPPPAFLQDDQPPFLQQEYSPQPAQQDIYAPQEVPQEPMFLQQAYAPQQDLYPTQPPVSQQQLHKDAAQFDPYVPVQQDTQEIALQAQHQANPYGPPLVEQPKHNVEPYAPPAPVTQQESQARTESVEHVEVHEEIHHVDPYAPPVIEKAVHQDPYAPLPVVQPATYEQPQHEAHQVDPYAPAPVVDQVVQEPSQREVQQMNPYAPAPAVEQVVQEPSQPEVQQINPYAPAPAVEQVVQEPSQPEVQQINPYAPAQGVEPVTQERPQQGMQQMKPYAPPPAAQQVAYQIDPYAPVEAPEIQQKAPLQQNPYAPQPPSIQRDPYSPQPASLQQEEPQLDVYSPPPASLHKQVPTQLLERDPYSPQTLQQEDLYAPQSNSLKQQDSHYRSPAALQQDLYSPKYQKQSSLQSPPSVQQGYLPGPPPPAAQHATQQPSHIPHDKPSNAPIISFGFGGKLVIHTPSSDSLDSPFTNSAVKSTPSSVAIYNLSTLLPPNLSAKFPGPLLGNTQTKKNQVVEYLDARISEEGFTNDQSKLTLLKVMKVLLLNNGVFSSKISQEIRQALLPDSEPRESSHKRAPSGLQITVPADETSPHIKPFPSSQTPYLVSSELNDGDSTVATYTTTSKALNILQELLVKGQKRDAVYFALENQLWSHALIISSCVDKQLWSESVNALTTHELGDGWDSLRVAYNLFAGTLNNSTPRASNWNMTAATLVSNLDSMDAQIALSNLGDKLINEGDIHAGHTCYLLAADTQKLKLLGYRGEGSDIDACRLTEILEYAYSLNPQHKKGDYIGLPHLQSHKLLHAWELTELDEISDANRYCEAIATTIKMSKGSPYYHPDLFIELKELSDRLSSRGDNNDKSWITKKMVRPSLDTLWNSMEGRLTKFIVGNDEDTQTPIAKPNEAPKDVGPFAQFTSIDVSSTNGKLSRAASALDLPNWNGISDRRVSDSPAYLSPEMVYNQPRAASAMGGLAGMDGNAPGAYGRGPPVSTSNSLNSGASFNEDVTPVATSFGAATTTNKMPPPPPPPGALKSPFGHTDVPSEDFNAPEEIDENEGGNFISLMDSMSAPIIPSTNEGSYMPTNNRTIDEIDELDEDDDLGFGNDSTKKAKEKRDKELKEKAGVNGGGLQAPVPDQVTQPGQQEPQPSAPAPPPAPASGWFSRSNTPVPEEKKPAEKRPELKQSASSSWLSRWWKKDDQQGNGPVKAKLGEQSSFYYDPAQKRWVNKNSDASSGSSPKMPPPPPRANTTSPGVGRPPAGRGSALKNSVSMDLKGGLSGSSATSAPLPARSPVAPAATPGPPAGPPTGPPTRPSSTTPGAMASSTSPPPPGSGQPSVRKGKKGGRPKYVAVNI